MVTANLVHLDKTSYTRLKETEGLHEDLKTFLNGCDKLMNKGEDTLHLITKGHDEKMLFDPQWAYSVIQDNGGTVVLGADREQEQAKVT